MHPTPTDTVVGVDGCRGAWVAAHVEGDEAAARLVGWRHGRFAAVLADIPPDRIVAVDIPVGLPERGRRPCDLAGRQALGPAAARLFLTPPRYAWAAPDPAAANALLGEHGEPGMSSQCYALRTAVLEVETFATDRRLVEVHPELSFLAARGRVLAPKRTAVGVGERIAALSGWIDVVAALAGAPTKVPVDDALDALAAAWTATRVRTGQARTYPKGAGSAAAVIRA
jgi:predicted RNase H-like nuclease